MMPYIDRFSHVLSPTWNLLYVKLLKAEFAAKNQIRIRGK
ncbi:MAG: hypothetical protein ACJAUG_001668 [Halioglobus sp.]|jgi:hypothetical protein